MVAYGLNITSLRKTFGITEEEVWKIRQFGEFAKPKEKLHAELFYSWMLETLPELHEKYFSDKELLKSVKKAQKLYWLQFFDAKINDEYLESRNKVGEAHAKRHLEPAAYLAGMAQSFTIWTEKLYDGELDEGDYQAATKAINRLISLDAAIALNTYGELIVRQSHALIEMSIPVSVLWEKILMMPIIGIIDSMRAEDMMERMLITIMKKQAKVFILDISGVGVMDSAVANHLIKMTEASELMGCVTIVSGISPQVAQTIVKLGIDVKKMRTTNTLEDALHFALEKIKN